jgi:hypothetical protein
VTASPQRGYSLANGTDSEAAVAIAKKKLKTFYASLHVTRVEDWCVDAETEDEARALLASGRGERCRIGERVYVEIDELSE